MRATTRPFQGDVGLLVSMLVVILCVWAFAALADFATGPHAQKLDERLMLRLRVPDRPSQPIGPPWLKGAMRDLTALGSPALLVLFVLAVGGALLVRRQYHAFALVMVAPIGARLLNMFLKELFGRHRPEVTLHLTEVRSPSFPSGHAMDSAVIYLILASLMMRLVQPHALKLYFLGLAMLMSFLAGLSRVFLGVHYPSDVLAGWCAGLAWAVLCWSVARHLQRRGSVEPAK